MRWLLNFLATVLILIALLLPFVGIGFADGPMSTTQKLLASGVLLIIALLLVLVGRRKA